MKCESIKVVPNWTEEKAGQGEEIPCKNDAKYSCCHGNFCEECLHLVMEDASPQEQATIAHVKETITEL